MARRLLMEKSKDSLEGLADYLKELRLPAFRASYEERARVAQQEGHGYEQYLLALAQRECQERQENVLVFGQPGSGKTHLLSAIGQELVRAGRKVVSRKCGLLVQELLAAKRDLKLPGLLKRYAGYEALILDDLGYVQQS